jgi:PhnB protein
MADNAQYIPEGFRTVTPYLTVKGAPQLLEFIKRVFDAEELSVTEHEGRIAHAAVRIGDSTVELSEATEQWGATPGALHVYVSDIDAVHRRAVEAGGVALYEPTDHPYGERGSAVKDPTGNNWYLATQIEVVSEEELARRMSKES